MQAFEHAYKGFDSFDEWLEHYGPDPVVPGVRADMEAAWVGGRAHEVHRHEHTPARPDPDCGSCEKWL